MRIFVTDRWDWPRSPQYPYVVLRRNTWDDYGFKTLFDALLSINATITVDLGSVKVLKAGMTDGLVAVASSPYALGADYCSLGQDIEYYQKLAELDETVRDDFLTSMRDIAANPEIENKFQNELGLKTSLLRFGQAANALTEGRRLLNGESSESRSGLLSFEFKDHAPDSKRTVAFNFDDTRELPGRTNVIIGYNGSGKTRLLADIAVAGSGFGEDVDESQVELVGQDTNFGAVIAVSYSAFDTFKTPSRQEIAADAPYARGPEGRTETFGYVYCGLRRLGADREGSSTALGQRDALKSIRDMEKEFQVAHAEAVGKRRIDPYFEALEVLSEEPSFGRIGVRPSDLAEFATPKEALRSFRRLSTGHKIVVHIMTQLAAHLRPRSLVLIDEPESHLHPPLTAALLKATQQILASWDSFAIVATHSPVVLQEIPAAHVQVLERYADSSIVRDPEIETFGAGVGVVTREVFSLNSSATDYQDILRKLADQFTVEQIDAMFEHGASAQALALVRNYQAKRRSK